MKNVLFFLAAIGLFSCQQPSADSNILQSRLDSLERKLSNTYKPGFGEFMSSIQAHHAKLWFAGSNGNWPLADFEIHEIGEAIDNIRMYQTSRPESEKIDMLKGPLDSVMNAIQLKDPSLFKRNYTVLTNSCNDCHRATKFEFNVVKVPVVSPFSNQDFRLPE